jgi:hypothetical protein
MTAPSWRYACARSSRKDTLGVPDADAWAAAEVDDADDVLDGAAEDVAVVVAAWVTLLDVEVERTEVEVEDVDEEVVDAVDKVLDDVVDDEVVVDEVVVFEDVVVEEVEVVVGVGVADVVVVDFWAVVVVDAPSPSSKDHEPYTVPMMSALSGLGTRYEKSPMVRSRAPGGHPMHWMILSNWRSRCVQGSLPDPWSLRVSFDPDNWWW